MDYRRDNKFVITRTDIQRLLGDIKGLEMALEDDVCTENCKTTSSISDRQKIEYAQKKS